ncbi:MAG: hypothetical protein QOD57_2610 [Actinomycetota bacterium]|jgi:hypothetical protein|nr:hypothetical protein [Actinomycetota bacterium]
MVGFHDAPAATRNTMTRCDHFSDEKRWNVAWTIQVTGIRELRNALKAAEGRLPSELRKGLNEVANIIVVDARRHIPVRSGKLAGTLRARSTQTAAQVVLGTARTPYAQAVYWGTGPRPGQRGPHNIKPHQVMHESFDRNKAPIANALRSVLDRLAATIEA